MLLQLFAILLANILVKSEKLWIDCPEPEDLTLCSCRWLLAPVITCSQIKSQKDLQSNFETIKGYAIKDLFLSGVTTSAIPQDLFKGLYARKVVIDNFEVKDDPLAFGPAPFSGLEKSLEELEIKKSFNKHKPLLSMKLDHLQKLKVASFEDNNIPGVGNEWFANGPKTLKMLLFERSEIKELGNKAFQSLDNLMFITLSGNHFGKVYRSMFPSPAKHLMKIDLSYNGIDNLASDFFSDMPSLSEINFSDNNIHLLPEATWSEQLLRIARLYFDGNPLECNEDLKWVCESRAEVVVATCVSPKENHGLKVRQFCKK